MQKKFLGVFLLLFSCFSLIVSRVQATNILALDGGGIRGVIAIEMLINLQKATGLDPSQVFDVYAGTSTGSIVAVLLAAGMDLDQLLEEYKEMSKNVFSNPNNINLFRPKYSNEQLKESLTKLLRSLGYDENTRLCELPKKIVIPTTNLYDAERKRWAPNILENFTEEGGEISVIDAILRSTAAPVYFPSYDFCVDGGMGMKDPSLAAISYACYFEKVTWEDIVVLSVGTGYTEEGIEHDVNWGLVEWAPKLLDMLMDVGDQIPEILNQKLMGDSFIKIDFALSQDIALDDYKQIDVLVDMADTFVKENPIMWNHWCQWTEMHLTKDLPQFFSEYASLISSLH